MTLNELPQIECSEIGEAVKRFGLYLIYKGDAAKAAGQSDVRLVFDSDELFVLGSLMVQHVNCSTGDPS